MWIDEQLCVFLKETAALSPGSESSSVHRHQVEPISWSAPFAWVYTDRKQKNKKKNIWIHFRDIRGFLQQRTMQHRIIIKACILHGNVVYKENGIWLELMLCLHLTTWGSCRRRELICTYTRCFYVQCCFCFYYFYRPFCTVS